MNLHRSGSKPQWEMLPPGTPLNIWQKIAKATHGIITPGNITTAAGVALERSGTRDIKRGRTLKGVAKIAGAAACDFVDGLLAEMTKTKSPLGEIADTVADKGKMADMLIGLTSMEVVPTVSAAVIGTQNSLNAGFSAYAFAKRRKLRAIKEGKISAGLQQGTVAVYGLAALAKQRGHTTAGRILEVGGHIGTAVSIVPFGMKSTSDYAQGAFGDTVLEQPTHELGISVDDADLLSSVD